MHANCLQVYRRHARFDATQGLMHANYVRTSNEQGLQCIIAGVVRPHKIGYIPEQLHRMKLSGRKPFMRSTFLRRLKQEYNVLEIVLEEDEALFGIPPQLSSFGSFSGSSSSSSTSSTRKWIDEASDRSLEMPKRPKRSPEHRQTRAVPV